VRGGHSPDRLAATQHRADGVDAEYVFEGGRADILDPREAPDHARAVHQTPDDSEPARGSIEQPDNIFFAADVRRDRVSRAACRNDFGDHRIRGFLIVQIVNRNRPTTARRQAGGFGADASAGARNNNGGHQHRITWNLLR
jgi:hypothetical protein